MLLPTSLSPPKSPSRIASTVINSPPAVLRTPPTELAAPPTVTRTPGRRSGNGFDEVGAILNNKIDLTLFYLIFLIYSN